ncbi:MAG TPA: Fur family transcriptional regulator [Patescibacteria group bacterium]|nr:Fur family transcriptional regulator [Patescibacteria group bacterium]
MTYLTKQKTVLNQVFEQAQHPLTAREICRRARRKLPSLGIATVYRALRRFVLSGRIRVVEIPGVPPHYERAATHHHHFFLCQQCKQLFDLVGCVRGVRGLAPRGFQVLTHEIVLYGQCAACTEQSARI